MKRFLMILVVAVCYQTAALAQSNYSLNDEGHLEKFSDFELPNTELALSSGSRSQWQYSTFAKRAELKGNVKAITVVDPKPYPNYNWEEGIKTRYEFNKQGNLSAIGLGNYRKIKATFDYSKGYPVATFEKKTTNPDEIDDSNLEQAYHQITIIYNEVNRVVEAQDNWSGDGEYSLDEVYTLKVLYDNNNKLVEVYENEVEDGPSLVDRRLVHIRNLYDSEGNVDSTFQYVKAYSDGGGWSGNGTSYKIFNRYGSTKFYIAKSSEYFENSIPEKVDHKKFMEIIEFRINRLNMTRMSKGWDIVERDSMGNWIKAVNPKDSSQEITRTIEYYN